MIALTVFALLLLPLAAAAALSWCAIGTGFPRPAPRMVAVFPLRAKAEPRYYSGEMTALPLSPSWMASWTVAAP
jgi:hypothetical protein